jgi:tRNA-specific 2-thiouridylase
MISGAGSPAGQERIEARQTALRSALSPVTEGPLTKDGRRRRVLVAMSGGVDSSVAAALLVEAGYEVVGVTMQVWDYSSCDITEGMGTCCSSIDVDDARGVADRMGFPFYVMNCEAKFQSYVIDPFIGAYLEGQTPLPCVNCNTYLKFDHLVLKMRELDCDYIATGHYARIARDTAGRAFIETATDDLKDQTYFLFTLAPELLGQILFPIGHLNKTEVRSIATELGLLNARKKDSTGICFVGSQGYSKFIEGQVAPDLLPPGQIRLYPSGDVLAEHSGIHSFTYGQRKGLGVATGQPLFVLRTDPKTQTVWVGPEGYLFTDRAFAERSHFQGPWQDGERVTVKIRFQHRGASARLFQEPESGLVRIEFDDFVRAVTPGQAAVFYRGSELLGGGWLRAGELGADAEVPIRQAPQALPDAGEVQL